MLCLKFRSNIIHLSTPRTPSDLLSSDFQIKVGISHLILSIYPSYHPNNIWWRVQLGKSSTSCFLLLPLNSEPQFNGLSYYAETNSWLAELRNSLPLFRTQNLIIVFTRERHWSFLFPIWDILNSEVGTPLLHKTERNYFLFTLRSSLEGSFWVKSNFLPFHNPDFII
jgi:hypothetical protein